VLQTTIGFCPFQQKLIQFKDHFDDWASIARAFILISGQNPYSDFSSNLRNLLKCTEEVFENIFFEVQA